MKDLKTEWLYYIDKYKYVLGKSKKQDNEYILTLPDRVLFLEYLKKCSLKEFISMMVNIFKDRYPNENSVVFASLSQTNFRVYDDIEPVVNNIDTLYNLISYTMIFREEQQGVIQLIENILSDKEVSVDTQEDQTVFKVVNSPIKELMVSNKRLTLNVNEDFIIL